MKSKTIKVSIKTKSELDEIGKKNESYDQIVYRLLKTKWLKKNKK